MGIALPGDETAITSRSVGTFMAVLAAGQTGNWTTIYEAQTVNLLVLDTATDRCALACSVNGAVSENTRSIPRLHNEYLLTMLDELLAEVGIGPTELDAIGFAAGPGSFTGIRISAAVSQALALSARAGVVALSSSRLLACAARRSGVGDPSSGIQTVLRSRRNFAYLASFAADLSLLADDVLFADDALTSEPLPVGGVRVMDAASEAAAQLSATPVAVGVEDLLALTETEIAAGRLLPPEGAQPRYVEGDTPWTPR